MDIFVNVWNNWTNYEKITTIGMLIAILVAIPLIILLFSKNKTLFSISLISLVSTGILTILIFFLLNQIFNVTITYIYKLVPFIVLFSNILSLGAMSGYYIQNHKHRDFDVLAMKKEMQKDTGRLTMSLILFFTGMSIFTESILLPLLLSLGLSLAQIWINYLLLAKRFKIA